MKYFLVNLALCIFASDFMVIGYGMSSSLVLDQDQPSPRCKASKALSLVQVDCSERKLRSVPNNLDTNIQVMVLTYNRLRSFPPGSFSRYRSLEYLYLGNNVLPNITKETIEELPYLQALDLSDNSLVDLSPSLFELSYLRKLYLETNYLKDVTFDREVKSPLELLQVAGNDLTKVPSIGPQAKLTTLNLSSNAISRVSTEDLAPYCFLKHLDLRENPISFDPSTCDCFHFNAWVNIRNLNVKPSFPCNNSTFESCQTIPFSNQTIESYNRCLEIIEIHAAAIKAKSTWTIVACCVAAFIVCAMIGFYCRHKRNKKRNRKLKEEQTLAANNANTELLNGNLPDQLSVKALHE